MPLLALWSSIKILSKEGDGKNENQIKNINMQVVLQLMMFKGLQRKWLNVVWIKS